MIKACRLTKIFRDKKRGEIFAANEVSFHVEPGQIYGLLGANGAGKTTTLRAISRLVKTAGTIRLDGVPVQSLATEDVACLGVAHAPEGRGTFVQLSVEENLRLGAWGRRSKAGFAEDLARVYSWFPVLRERRHQAAGTLSGGEQQMLAIGRAIMGRPRLLLLDEPSMGLAPLMVQKIFETIRSIAASGVTTLLVEQNARLALEICSRGYVMESGEITLTDDAARLLANPRVRRAYLGE